MEETGTLQGISPTYGIYTVYYRKQRVLLQHRLTGWGPVDPPDQMKTYMVSRSDKTKQQIYDDLPR